MSRDLLTGNRMRTFRASFTYSLRASKNFPNRALSLSLKISRLLAITSLISTTQYHDPVGVVRSLTEGRGADVAIEAVGKPQTWEMCVHMVRRGGTVNFFGGCPSDSRVSLDTSLLHYSEITCKASFHHTPAHIRRALDPDLHIGLFETRSWGLGVAGIACAAHSSLCLSDD